MGRKRTGQRPGHPGKTRFIPVGIPKLTKRQWRALIHERRAPIPFIDIFGEMEPKPSLSTRDLRELVGVSSTTISNWRRNAAYQYGFRFASMKAFARKHPLGLAPPAPVTKLTKKQADDRLMTQQSSEQVDKKSNFVESPIGDDLDPILSANLDPADPHFANMIGLSFANLFANGNVTAPKNCKSDALDGSLGRYFTVTKRCLTANPIQSSGFKEAIEISPKETPSPTRHFRRASARMCRLTFRSMSGRFNIRQQEVADEKAEFFKKGNVDCIRITTNPGLRTGNTSGLVQRKIQRKGKAVRRLIAKRGDALEVYVGKATKEHQEQYPSEWQAYLAAQRGQPTKNEG